MRQVPYGIIGTGRVARHMCHYLTLLSIPYLQISARASAFDLEPIIVACDPLLILINDDAIEPYLQNHPSLQQKTRVHFSGSLTTMHAHGAHPLMTFSTELYDLDIYQKIPFVIEKNNLKFNQLLPGLSNPHFEIDAALKSFYHSLCVMSSNFTAILWQKFFQELEHKFSIPKSAVFPYLEQTCLNLMRQENALTGPLIRNDQQTITSNLQALNFDPFQKIYQAFVDVYAQMPERSL